MATCCITVHAAYRSCTACGRDGDPSLRRYCAVSSSGAEGTVDAVDHGEERPPLVGHLTFEHAEALDGVVELRPR